MVYGPPAPTELRSNQDIGRVAATGEIVGFDPGDLTVIEVSLTESLLTPGLQTSVTCQAPIYRNINFDFAKNKNITLRLNRQIDGASMSILQRVYRLDNRGYTPINVGQTQQFVIHACDQSLLRDAGTLVSRSWKCESPNRVVEDVLGCIGSMVQMDDAGPGRHYIAERIHPFQVVAQQANVALNGGNPDFVHYMTYIPGGGMHHFKSLNQLCFQQPIKTFYHNNTGILGRNAYPQGDSTMAIAFSFPCDFDLLTDILNGLDETGNNINVGSFWNPLIGAATGFGVENVAACSRGANFKQSMTNSGSAEQQQSCPTNVEEHLLKRQARMSLLDRDKVALRLTVPWSPEVHAGNLINLVIQGPNGASQYGSGTYLVSSMTHKILLGGFSTTTFDCVSNTVGGGEV